MTTVLLAEDNLTLLENIALELEFRGYQVLQASDGRGALDILRTGIQLPDIIISDIAMPDIDGFQFLEHLRSEPAWNGIPFLFLTAFNSPNSVRISKELGADDYIVKPFQADDLVLAMESKLKRLRAFQAKAEQHLDESRKTLLRMIAHELRTPLTAIYGGSEMLAECLEQVPDETVHRMLALIRNGANRLNHFTRKALVLIEVDSGNLEKTFHQSRRKHDIHEIVNMALNVVHAEMRESKRQVTINYTPAPQSLYVYGVEAYLTMAVDELLRNAVAFTPDNHAVDVMVNNGDAAVTVTIVDDGPGISEDELPHIWDRFMQIDREYYEQQGAGLGLSVVRDVVRIHGGDCVIANEPKRGARVTLSFPKQQEEEFDTSMY